MRRRSRTGSGSGSIRRRTTRQQRISTAGESSQIGQQLPEEILRQIQVAPLFRVTSLHGQFWYEPFDGRPVALRGRELDLVAENFLAQQADVISRRSPLAWRELQQRRWSHELPILLRSDPRFAVFGPQGQGWAEPFTGSWHDDISAPGKKLDRDTIQRMARILAENTQLALGEPLSVAELAYSRPQPGPDAPPTLAPHTPLAQQPATSPHNKADEPDTTTVKNTDLDDAKAVQNRQLARIPDMPGFNCAVHYEGHSAVSGDIYAVMPYGEQRYLIVVGDVTGHGMQAALIVSPLLKALRLLSPSHPDPVELLATVNDEIKGDLMPGQFVTMALAVVQTDTDMCEVVLAGHHPFVIVNPAHEHPVHQVGRMGMALGLTKGKLFHSSLKPVWLNLQDGDILLQCTDGILEAKDERDREYGLARFWGSALCHCDESASELVRRIAEDATHFAAQEMDDDVCVLALARPMADPEQRNSTTARAVHSTPRLGAVITTLNGQQAGESIASDDLESVFEELEVDEDEPSAEHLIQV